MTVDDALTTLRRNVNDRVAWEVLYLEQQPRLLAYVSSLLLTFKLPPGETAPDIVHDVMLSLIDGWEKGHHSIMSPGHLTAYLRRSCRNLLVDRYRHSRNTKELLSFLSLTFSDAFNDNVDLHRRIFLRQIIGQLPPECGALLRRYVLEDISPAELADIEGVLPSTFYSRWYRCIQKAREVYQQRL